MKYSSFIFSLFVVSLLFTNCRKDENLDATKVQLSDLKIIKNPSGVAPLTAEIKFKTNLMVWVKLRVKGKNGEASDVVQDFTSPADEFALPVLGLYPNFNNTIELQFFDPAGNALNTETLQIATQILIPEMPDVLLNKVSDTGSEPQFYLVNYFGHNGNQVPQRPFLFDQFGDIRWYLDFSGHPTLNTLFFDNGMITLENGNFAFGDGNSGRLYEIDRFGNILHSWSLNGYHFHHHLVEKPNGNFIVTVNDPAKTTIEDVIIELDRNTGEIVNTWDLNISLQNSRHTWSTDLADLNVDWIHCNGLAYSASDDAIIVSGRTQGIIKLSATNEVIWILAPHKDWDLAGNGTDLRDYLLTPLNAQGNPIVDPEVLNGDKNHPDFEWTWYQHSPILLPNGHLMAFDNGDNRNYSGVGWSGGYSRAVEYEIDETNKTIRQVWTYGKDKGGETYSRIVSKVNFYEDLNHVLFTPGAVLHNGINYGKVIEINRQTNEVVFEATLYPPIPLFNITFHNVQRAELYPD